MRTIFRYKFNALLSVIAAGAMAVIASAPVAAAPPKGAPAELKVAFVDFFSGGAAVFGGDEVLDIGQAAAHSVDHVHVLPVDEHGSDAGVVEQSRQVEAIVQSRGGEDFAWATQKQERDRLWQARYDAWIEELAREEAPVEAALRDDRAARHGRGGDEHGQ